MERTAALIVRPFLLEFDALGLYDGDDVVLQYLVLDK